MKSTQRQWGVSGSQRTCPLLAAHAEAGKTASVPMQALVESQSMEAKMASLGSMTPILLIVFSSVR